MLDFKMGGGYDDLSEIFTSQKDFKIQWNEKKEELKLILRTEAKSCVSMTVWKTIKHELFII